MSSLMIKRIVGGETQFGYDLLGMIQSGECSADVLTPLFESDDEEVFRCAMWIASELGEISRSFINYSYKALSFDDGRISNYLLECSMFWVDCDVDHGEMLSKLIKLMERDRVWEARVWGASLTVNTYQRAVKGDIKRGYGDIRFSYKLREERTLRADLRERGAVDFVVKLMRYALRSALYLKVDLDDGGYAHFGYDFYMYLGCHRDVFGLGHRRYVVWDSLFIKPFVSPWSRGVGDDDDV